MKRKFNTSIAAIAVLVALCIGLGVYGGMQRAQAAYYQARVDAVYQKSFYEVLDLLENIAVDLEKLTISANKNQETKILNEIVSLSEGTQDNISMLPFQHEVTADILKFVNQLGDYARSLSAGLGEGRALTTKDQEQILALREYCTSLYDRMQGVLDDAENGVPVWGEIEPRAEEIPENQAFTQSDVTYPTLIYDGPFADSQFNRDMRGLGGTIYTPEQAMERARQFVGANRVRQVMQVGEAISPVAGWEIRADTDSGSLEMMVSRQGGQILYMLPDYGNAQVVHSQGACADAAIEFLQARGFPQMQISFWQQNEGVLTINLAAVENGVLLYPDLVKVQVSMANLQIMGVEATNFWRNHVPRQMEAPALTMEEAQMRLKDTLSIQNSRLCLIPEPNGERLCYEFQVTSGKLPFIIYIDANTGEEAAILKVIDANEGQLVM